MDSSGISQAVCRVLELIFQIITAQGDQCLSLGNSAAFSGMDRGGGAAGTGCDRALRLVSKGAVARAAQTVDGSRGHLRRAETAGFCTAMVTSRVTVFPVPTTLLPEMERTVPFSVSKEPSSVT